MGSHGSKSEGVTSRSAMQTGIETEPLNAGNMPTRELPTSAINAERPLRILMILHMPWSRNLGGPRISVELADELRARGCHVHKYDVLDAFPKPNRLSAIFGPALFHKRAANYVRRCGHLYDIIQAEQGNLPYSKSSLRFGGLLVTHSSGLVHLHERVLRSFDTVRKQKITLGYLKGRILRFLIEQMSGGLGAYERSFDFADRIILLNKDELAFVATHLGHGRKAAFFPPGLSDQRLSAFAATVLEPEARRVEQRVVYIGRWSELKGSGDFPQLVRRIRCALPKTHFLLLGTGISETVIRGRFDRADQECIRVVPAFVSEELPHLLSNCTVGIFPSYTEGFGIGLLEKLAAGIPCVSYDIPGPREMLPQIQPALMVRVGDVEAMANIAITILQMPALTYEDICAKCISVAASFRWMEIAERTLRMYREGLSELAGSGTRMQV